MTQHSISTRNSFATSSVIATTGPDAPNWQRLILVTGILWLGGTLVLDLIVMPTLYMSGMMTDASFAPMGYTLFSNFNHMEVVSAAMLLTGTLALHRHSPRAGVQAIIAAAMLLALSLFYTYGLTPDMIALGAHLNLLKTTGIPHSMDVMHGEYFGLELVKLGLVMGLIKLSQR
ncbi:MAG: DUF4149 domain-containing protein [Cyanobacteria bacterium P01_A01_bin.135]